MEDIRQQSSIMNLEVKASLVSEPHNLFENEPDILDEKRIDEGINNFGVFVAGVLVQANLVLDEEMRDVVVEIDCFGDSVECNHFTSAVYNKSQILRRRIRN